MPCGSDRIVCGWMRSLWSSASPCPGPHTTHLPYCTPLRGEFALPSPLSSVFPRRDGVAERQQRLCWHERQDEAACTQAWQTVALAGSSLRNCFFLPIKGHIKHYKVPDAGVLLSHNMLSSWIDLRKAAATTWVEAINAFCFRAHQYWCILTPAVLQGMHCGNASSESGDRRWLQ